jgi:hypothetical protein
MYRKVETCIRKVPGKNLGRDNGSIDRFVWRFFSDPTMEYSRIILRLGHNFLENKLSLPWLT